MAIVTKLDALARNEKMELDYSGDPPPPDQDRDKWLEEESWRRAGERFEEHYQKPLMEMPHPPHSVIHLSHGRFDVMNTETVTLMLGQCIRHKNEVPIFSEVC